MSHSFYPKSEADIARLIRDYPLAWVVTTGASGFHATPLPLLAEAGPDGSIVSMLGHFALSNPQLADVRQDPAATILFMGPQGYISPRLVSNPTWGPTWNYATARFDVTIALVPEENDAALTKLAAALEGEESGAWRPADMGPRYADLARYIVAFRATIVASHARFKLGQDENDGTFGEIVDGLSESTPADRLLAEWMRRMRA